MKLFFLLLAATAAAVAADDGAALYVPEGWTVPAAEASSSCSYGAVADAVARAVGAAPVSQQQQQQQSARPAPAAFASLVGPTASARVRLVALPSAAAASKALSLAAAAAAPVAVAPSSEDAFPGRALVARLGARVLSSDADFRAAFPGAVPLSAPADAVAALGACGVAASAAADGSFEIGGAQFAADDAAWLAELATICDAATAKEEADDYEHQLTAVGAFSGVAAAAKYGADSAQAKALAQATDAVLARYIQASTEQRPRTQLFVLVTPSAAPLTAAVSAVGTVDAQPHNPNAVRDLLPSATNTPAVQIVLWFVVVMVLTVLATVVATFGVGVESVKDTLLYRATTTFH